MHFAVREGRMDIVKYLKDNGADLNVMNKVGKINYESQNTNNGLHDNASRKPLDPQCSVFRSPSPIPSLFLAACHTVIKESSGKSFDQSMTDLLCNPYVILIHF